MSGYTVDRVTNEDDEDRWFVADPNGDWINDGTHYDPANEEEAYEEARRLNTELIARMLNG